MLVVGAGVVGLTTAVRLAEQGLRVLIRAERPPQETTSAVAGAIWGPHLVEEGGRTVRWARETLGVLRDLAAQPSTGVRIATGVEAMRPSGGDGPPPALSAKFSELPGVRACEPAELPAGFAAGWRYSAPLVHMPTYLGYLLARFEGAGGRATAGSVTSLADAAHSVAAGVVVNCTGTSARELASDPELTAVRGQVVVATNPGLSEFFIGLGSEDAELIYVFPHGDTVVLGGTEKAGDWDLSPDPAVAERILRDCTGAVPRLQGARVLSHRVGLRPVRPSVRVEADEAASGDALSVMHNYGHGGAGVSLSWGCASQITGMVARAGLAG